MEKKINLGDVAIQIRILRALADIKPFGLFKHFYVLRILRNLKQPNVITAKHIWDFLNSEYDIKYYDAEADKRLVGEPTPFELVFDE